MGIPRVWGEESSSRVKAKREENKSLKKEEGTKAVLKIFNFFLEKYSF